MFEIDPLTAIASVPAIVAVVNLGKDLGLPSKASMVLAVVLGVLFAVGDHYLGGDAGYQAATSGLLLGLAAAGVYDLAKTGPAPRRAMTDADG